MYPFLTGFMMTASPSILFLLMRNSKGGNALETQYPMIYVIIPLIALAYVWRKSLGSRRPETWRNDKKRMFIGGVLGFLVSVSTGYWIIPLLHPL